MIEFVMICYILPVFFFLKKKIVNPNFRLFLLVSQIATEKRRNKAPHFIIRDSKRCL